MQKNIFRKGLVVGIILLFVGTSVIPGISGNIEQNNDILQVKSNRSTLSSTTDWWPMFQHDLNHSGYSTSKGPDKNDILWIYTTGYYIYSGPAVINNNVIFGSADCNVYCLNAETGEKIWNYTTGGWVTSAPVVKDGKVYIGSGDFNFYCIDENTGMKIWNHTMTEGVWRSSAAVYDGKVFFGSGDHNVICLNAETGEKIWNYTTGNRVESSPAIANGKLYIASEDQKLYCLDTENGGKIWDYHIGGYGESSPAVADGKVYIGSMDPYNMYCLDAETGEKIWDNPIGLIISSPAVVNGKVYIGSLDSNVYCLDAGTGEKLWNYKTSNQVYSSPAVADGKVYIGSYDQNVYCLNAETGEKIWNYTTGHGVVSSPAIANEKVFIGSYDYKLYCFKQKNQPPNPPIINGSTSGKPGHSYSYTFVSEDPDGDHVYYQINWGDGIVEGWFGPNESNEIIIKSHSWSEKGTYTIMARAKDVYGAIGEWETLTVTMPRNKAINRRFLNFIQNHPNLLPILQKIIQRLGLQ